MAKKKRRKAANSEDDFGFRLKPEGMRRVLAALTEGGFLPDLPSIRPRDEKILNAVLERYERGEPTTEGAARISPELSIGISACLAKGCQAWIDDWIARGRPDREGPFAMAVWVAMLDARDMARISTQ